MIANFAGIQLKMKQYSKHSKNLAGIDKNSLIVFQIHLLRLTKFGQDKKREKCWAEKLKS